MVSIFIKALIHFRIFYQELLRWPLFDRLQNQSPGILKKMFLSVLLENLPLKLSIFR